MNDQTLKQEIKNLQELVNARNKNISILFAFSLSVDSMGNYSIIEHINYFDGSGGARAMVFLGATIETAVNQLNKIATEIKAKFNQE